MESTLFIEYWKNLIQDKTTKRYRLPDVFKHNFQCIAYDCTGITVGVFEIIGAWPMQSGALNFQSTSSERITRTVDFSVDDIVFMPYVNGSPVRMEPSKKDKIISALTKNVAERSKALISQQRLSM